MDNSKTGALIAQARKERHMTQRELASLLCLSDKTISKWERGLGSPDISVLQELSCALGITVQSLLGASPQIKSGNTGNMRRAQFYVCPVCMNILIGNDEADIVCCGKPLNALQAMAPDDDHHPHLEIIGHETYLYINHTMSKTHYIGFIAYVTSSELRFFRLYPEQNAETHLRIGEPGFLYVWCNLHGLFVIKI